MLVQSHNKHFLPSKLEKKDYGTWQYKERVRYRSLFLSRARCCSTEPKDAAPVRDRCDLRQIVRETGDGATDLFSGFVGFSLQVWSDCDCLRRPALLTPARFRLLTTTRRCRVLPRYSVAISGAELC